MKTRQFFSCTAFSLTVVTGLLLVLTSAPAEASADGLCASWMPSEKIGELDSKIVDESSGLARSKKFDALYHINDSGTAAKFHVSDSQGSKIVSVEVEDFTPRDPEEIALAVCPHNPLKTCVVIADIGDNLARRKSVALFFIEERAQFPKKVKADYIARFKYPDKPHNAEAVAVLDNGDVVILTKEMSLAGNAEKSQVFRAKRSSYIGLRGEAALLEKTGEIDIPGIVKKTGYGGLVTAMSVVGDGRRFAVLTYESAIEFFFNLSSDKIPSGAELKEGIQYRVIPLFVLPQQESLAYDVNNRDLLYSTEVMERLLGFGPPAPIYKVRCAP